MSESIWWPDEAWWERKSLPLGFITLSFRQLATILLSFLTAFVVSLPFEFAIAGASFGGRAAVFCIVFGIGIHDLEPTSEASPYRASGVLFSSDGGPSRSEDETVGTQEKCD